MSSLHYLWRTLFFHWRTNLAVWLGVAAGTAVLAGALIVGDSVRGSLQMMTRVRLGRVDHLLQSPRFIRENLAAELAAMPGFSERFATIAPAIVLPAVAERAESKSGSSKLARRAGKVQLYGLSESGWRLIDADRPAPVGTEVVLNARLARQLGAHAGDEVLFEVELPSDIPRDTLLGKREGNSVEWPATVREILPEESGAGRFGLLPDQQLPLSAFVSLQELQDRLGLAAREPTRRDPTSKPARVNTLLVSAIQPLEREDPPAVEAALDLDRRLAQGLQPADLHLRLVPLPDGAGLSVESERMILDRQAVLATERAARATGASVVSPAMVYIANSIRPITAGSDGAEGPASGERISRYAVVAGIEPQLLDPHAEQPFGTHRFTLPVKANPLVESGGDPTQRHSIIINDWLAQDLKVGPGDELELTWHQVGSHGELPEESGRFVVRGVTELEPTQRMDRSLVPEVAGITNVESFDQWDAPFPMKSVTPRDDEYWKRYRATPKAFVMLATAQNLWRNRYGDVTSLRVAPPAIPGDFESRFRDRFRHELKPLENGLRFRPVKHEGLKAASGTTDFGGLFLGFSLFLILSAAILIGLLFRLGVDRRAANVGLLLATGLSPRQVRRLLLAEGGAVMLLGVLAGLGSAVLYAEVMIHGLKTWWVGAIGTRFLDVYLTASSLILGGVASLLVALTSLVWGLRGLLRIPPRRLLSGVSTPQESAASRSLRGRGAGRRAISAATLAVLLTLGVATGIIPQTEAFSGFSWPTVVFILVGLLTLAGGLWALGAWIDSDRASAVQGRGVAGLARLAVRNAARHRARSLLSASLIATATFLIVAIAAGHRNPAVETPDRATGNGGFTLVGESSVPILQDLNSAAGRSKLGLDDEPAQAVLRSVRQIVPFRLNPGENASCLNIYRTTQPTILGATPEMIQRGGFKFADTRAAEPWKLLESGPPDLSIPVLGDLNTLQYSLHLGLGSKLEIRAEDGTTHELKIAGMYDGSVFQGVLVMHERHFAQLFPSRVGYQYFLVDIDGTGDSSGGDEVAELLESRLPGFDAERVSDRLTNFLAVQNTYLSTFQALGGLGLLMGTIGLSIVMLRNILERRSELALLRAVGFSRRSLARLVVFENVLLLGWGLACGTLSALLAMGPHLLTTGADLPWLDVVLLLSGVFGIGMSTAWLTARAATRTPVVATLRSGT